MTNPTRALATQLREIGEGCNGSRQNDTICIQAAAAIDALLDAIEAGGMVQPRPAPVMDLGPLRVVRSWHWAQSQNSNHSAVMHEFHKNNVKRLNVYFPEGDRL